jgi:hypothetical protein
VASKAHQKKANQIPVELSLKQYYALNLVWFGKEEIESPDRIPGLSLLHVEKEMALNHFLITQLQGELSLGYAFYPRLGLLKDNAY